MKLYKFGVKGGLFELHSGWERCSVVKLHFNLRILTQLHLVGVGVDFVFPQEEGRRKKKEGRNNPHLGSSRGCDSTCLKFLVAVWKVLGNCLERFWQMS